VATVSFPHNFCWHILCPFVFIREAAMSSPTQVAAPHPGPTRGSIADITVSNRRGPQRHAAATEHPFECRECKGSEAADTSGF